MDSTPLLIGSGSLPGPTVLQDHPVFLRASHSPWFCIPQNVLVFFRGLILAYLVATGCLILNYELTEDTTLSNYRLFFDFAIISFVLVLLYYIITFCWTFTHLYYPDVEEVDGRLEWIIISMMSLPRNLASLRKQFYFSLFYTTTVVFAFMNTVIYWFITRPHDIETAPVSDIFGQGWFKSFCILNLYGITAIIMIIEILFLNSIKRPFSIYAHIFSLLVLAGLFLAWAAIGRAATGVYSFFWLDPQEVGSQEAVAAYCIGFVLLAPICFIFMQGFVGIRESLTRPRVILQAAPLEA
ncbi:hypothetical protein M441DRAFT_135928 [Trichoderma asperellum CBS 433.97]|uniref:FAR-17a/AIG1-like protein n=1 Tax=Trichoderma asperellum (strain ATCC 204424 / CBS 433.97 / NBRC 101777) TaxID=1042311 RepID=A0A2T3ZFN6_TRIA4|nr:hypothetical protein M441DRAFT_135928 [Trichoderma asperellum CBS 433.97]PTB43626.1 hypothetical protein M441DRAFT_135928 [Trichoderma asperellum CBS 433.97]